jgi:hypothetical protein
MTSIGTNDRRNTRKVRVCLPLSAVAMNNQQGAERQRQLKTEKGRWAKVTIKPQSSRSHLPGKQITSSSSTKYQAKRYIEE